MTVTAEITLEGRRVLVTGGGQGVGHGLATAFASAGAHVLAAGSRWRCDVRYGTWGLIFSTTHWA